MKSNDQSPKAIADRLALFMMTLGIAMVWQPWIHNLFRWGFLVTLAGVILFTISSHMASEISTKNPMKPE